jgi:hypothetical protein
MLRTGAPERGDLRGHVAGAVVPGEIGFRIYRGMDVAVDDFVAVSNGRHGASIAVVNGMVNVPNDYLAWRWARGEPGLQ